MGGGAGFGVVDGVEGAPEGVQGFVGGGQDFGVVFVGVFEEPVAPGGAVGFVGFFVDFKVGQGFRLIEGVEIFEAIDFRGGDFGNLGFVGVEGGYGFRDGAVAADFAEGLDDVLRAGQGGAVGDVVFADAEGGGEIAPELGMRGGRVFFFGEIFQHDLADGAFGAGSENAQVPGERFDVAVVLGGIELQG